MKTQAEREALELFSNVTLIEFARKLSEYYKNKNQ